MMASTVFGTTFYGLAFGALGPALRLMANLSRDRTRSTLQHVLCHLIFGVTTALVADGIARRM